MNTTVQLEVAPTWDLDSIFPGGSESKEFADYRAKIAADLDSLEKKITRLSSALDSSSIDEWAEFINQWQLLIERIELVLSFTSCLISANVNDSTASTIESEGYVFYSRWEKMKAQFESWALNQPDELWNQLLATDKLNGINFFLNEMRTQAKNKMTAEKESLVLDLSVSGYQAWNQIYEKTAGDLRVHFEENGKSIEMSLGQLATKMSDADRSVRKQAFEKMSSAWQPQADKAAIMLNSLVGFRLAVYKQRGWTDPLHEALVAARLSRESLDAMWSVISKGKNKLAPYIEAKKNLLGIDKYRWYDEFAPCGAVEMKFSYSEAAEFIIKHTAAFSSDLSDFCKMAIDKKWIEAEDRPGKRGGGFCTGTGPLRQSRIFMTYANNYENLLTLAHELGHAYHSYVLREHPYLATSYPMTLAETASIFSELLVTDAALEACDDPQEKIMLIDQKLQQPYIFFCDIHCRYLFDSMLHEDRQKGALSAKRLSEMMISAQKEAYGPMLDESGYHPLFWVSKLHFFITDTPFYNFPYTFGFLFAGGVYDRAKKEGKAFAPKYAALLADSGSMSSEDVAKKHLDVDLRTESFWQSAVDRSLTDVDEFVKLTN